jgi:hypothetical protein
MQVEKMVVVDIEPKDLYDTLDRDNHQVLELIIELDNCVNDGEFTSRAIDALSATLQDHTWSVWVNTAGMSWHLVDESDGPHGFDLTDFRRVHEFVEADAGIAELVYEAFQAGWVANPTNPCPAQG